MKVKITSEEFLVEGYISSDNNVVTAAIFITVVPSINGDFCLGAYYGYAGGANFFVVIVCFVHFGHNLVPYFTCV